MKKLGRSMMMRMYMGSMCMFRRADFSKCFPCLTVA